MTSRRAAWITVLCAVLPMAGAFAMKRMFADKAPNRVRAVPDFNMRAIHAASVSPFGRKDLDGRPWIANFIFTNCAGQCPMASEAMEGLQSALPAGIRLVTFTVDPDRDTPAVLREYARRFHADPARWLFAMGDKGELYKLMYEGFNLPVVEDRRAPSGFRVTHSAKFVLVDSRGMIRGYYGIDDSDFVERLRSDALKVLNERPS